MNDPSPIELAFLTREAFDELVNGNPISWRKCVREWEKQKRKITKHLPKELVEIQMFLDSAHDETVTAIVESEHQASIKFASGRSLALHGIVESTKEHRREQLPFAFLYGELHPQGELFFIHLLMDATDYYAICSDLSLD